MKKCYVIVIDEVYDYETQFHKPEVYTTKEKASHRLSFLYHQFNDELDNDWKRSVSDDCASFYLDGEYSCNHLDITLHEVIVNQELIH